MDGKVSYARFVLCNKRHEETPIRREMTIFPKVSKSAVFCEIAKRGPGENFPKMADFLGKFRKVKRIGNTSRIIA